MTLVDLRTALPTDRRHYRLWKRSINCSWRPTFKVELAGLFAALLGGRELKQFFSDVKDVNVAIGNLQANIGQTEPIAGWQAAWERLGGSAAGATGALRGAQQAIANFRTKGTLGDAIKGLMARGTAAGDRKETTLAITLDMTPQQAAEAFLATIRGAVVLEYEAEEDGCDPVREQAQKAKAEALPDAMSEP